MKPRKRPPPQPLGPARTEATPELARITTFGTRFITTRYPDRPALLAELNITQSPTTYAGETFRRGPMSV